MMSRRVVGKQMVITIHIERTATGLYVARSRNAPGFLASHVDEAALREELPFMARMWASDKGLSAVTIKVLPPKTKQNRSDEVRLAITHGEHEEQRELVAHC